MKSKKSYIFLLVIILLFTFCAKREVLKDREGNVETDEDITAQIEADIEDIYAWVNLMPGADFKPKFHITGKIVVDESNLYDFKKLRMVQINIYQKGNRVFEIQPEVRESDEETSEDSKYIIFSTVEGESYNDEFNPDNSVDIKILFLDDGKIYSYMIYDIDVDEVH